MPKYRPTACPTSSTILAAWIKVTHCFLVLEKSARFSQAARSCHRTCLAAYTCYIKCSLHSTDNYRSLCRNGIRDSKIRARDNGQSRAHGKRFPLGGFLYNSPTIKFLFFDFVGRTIDRSYGEVRETIARYFWSRSIRIRFSGFVNGPFL